MQGDNPLLGELTSTLRTFVGLSSMAPVALGGVATGAVLRDRRSGVNFFTSIWPKLFLTLGGVKLNVTGVENLGACRPAVFIFNHRNSFDVLIAAALVRENWTAVSKKELEHGPVAGACSDRGHP